MSCGEKGEGGAKHGGGVVYEKKILSVGQAEEEIYTFENVVALYKSVHIDPLFFRIQILLLSPALLSISFKRGITYQISRTQGKCFNFAH